VCGRLTEGCTRAQSAFRPHLLACNVPKRGCIYIDDVCLEGTQPGECEAESELVRYALSYGEMWTLNEPSNADAGGASFFLTTRTLGGGVREPIFSDPHARTRALRALRHTVTVAVSSDLRHVLISRFVTTFQHVNIDVALDTVSMYSYILDAFIAATCAQPSSELTDEFTYLTHARAPLATVAFILESLAHSTNTGKPLMPADAIKAAATSLCDYRSLFPGARQVIVIVSVPSEKPLASSHASQFPLLTLSPLLPLLATSSASPHNPHVLPGDGLLRRGMCERVCKDFSLPHVW
jgi:hypothetical protein